MYGVADAFTSSSPRWWAMQGQDLASAVVKTCDNLERTQAERRTRHQRNIEQFEGRKLGGLYPSAYFNSFELATESYDVSRANLVRSVVATAVAKVAGKQKPKTQFVVNDADWSTKRRAKKMEKFVEAHMLARQGNFHDVYEVAILAFRDACVTDSGWLKFWPDMVERRVVVERVLPWEIIVDPYESRYGNPQNLFHVYGYDRDKLVERFPKFKAQILDAPSLEEDGAASQEVYGYGAEVARLVKVREAWRLPPGPDRKGKHSMVLSSDVDLAGGEDYTRPFFPFLQFVWEPWFFGMFGTSLADQVTNLGDEYNAHLERWSQSERLASNVIIQAEQGVCKEEELKSNLPATILWRTVGAQPVVITVPETLGASSRAWGETVWSKGFEMTGVSQMSATAEKPAGVTAAVAMDTLENIGSERFAVQWQQFERVLAIGAPRQILACAREIGEDDPEYAIKWPGSGFLKTFKLQDVDLDDDVYSVQPYAVSGLVNTPADRLQLASDLFTQQIISKDAYLRIIQAKDIDRELDGTDIQTRLIESYVETWLDSTEEQENDGTLQYRPPTPFMNQVEAIVQVGRSYMQAELDGAPDFNLGFFMRFMGECDQQIQKQQAKQAELQAASRGKGEAPAPDASVGPGPAPAPAPGAPAGAVLQ